MRIAIQLHGPPGRTESFLVALPTVVLPDPDDSSENFQKKGAFI
jgi:hypothetical protein